MANVLSLKSGLLELGVSEDTGGIALAGPDRSGAPLATVVTFEPPVATIGGNERTIGRVVSSTPLPNGFELVQDAGGINVTAHVTFPADGVLRYKVVNWNGLKPDQTSVAAAADGDEHFYGFGEKFNALDQAKHKVEVLTFDNPGNKGDRSYKVAPWFISTRGYGFHLESTARSTFDMGTAAGRYVVTNFFRTLAFQVVYGPQLTDVLSRYTGLTGRPSLPPPFTFGPWISSDVWRDGGEIRYAVTMFRKRGIPVSAFVFDSPWEIAYNDFKFNIPAPDFHSTEPAKTQFGHPGTFEGVPNDGFNSLTQMMTFFREKGLKVICWMTPFVNTASVDEKVRGQNLGAAVPDNKEDRFFVRASKDGPPLVVPWWKGKGSPIDFTLLDARRWLADRLTALVNACLVDTKTGKESAIGGFKTDDGEARTNKHANCPGIGCNEKGIYIPDDASYADTRTGLELQNGYCLEYHKTVHGVLGKDGVLFARSGFTGTQAFPGCWAGDNEPNFGTENGLPSVIVAGLSAAMSGFAIWGHDIGGYQNTNFSTVSPADLFIRWTQFGCFSPIMQMHRQVDGNNLRQYPWGYPEAGERLDKNHALDNYKFYATLHTRLFPALYTYAKQSSETGLPILRPLVLTHPDDPETFGRQDQYYFGGDLLVAPVIEPKKTQRQIYLPAGDWVDFWTNERQTGSKEITWNNPPQPDQPRSKIPVFVRNGAIVPLILGEDVQTLCDANYVNNSGVKSWDGGLEIRIYPEGDSQFTMFDGTAIRCVVSAAGTTVTLTSTPRAVELRVLAPRPAAGIRRDGSALIEAGSPTAFDAAASAWRSEAAVLHIKFPHTGGTTTVSF
jgi:alpha-D-xyloside xylohydrolase